jgi:hypothetical protein
MCSNASRKEASMSLETGNTVKVVATSDEPSAEHLGKVGTVLRIIRGFATFSGQPHPPLYRVRFSESKTGVFWAEELEKSS